MELPLELSEAEMAILQRAARLLSVDEVQSFIGLTAEERRELYSLVFNGRSHPFP